MLLAFSEHRFDGGHVADRFRLDLAVANQAFGAGFYAVIAFDLDHRSQNGRNALLRDPNELFRQ
jgi:hypothetical protein